MTGITTAAPECRDLTLLAHQPPQPSHRVALVKVRLAVLGRRGVEELEAAGALPAGAVRVAHVTIATRAQTQRCAYRARSRVDATSRITETSPTTPVSILAAANINASRGPQVADNDRRIVQQRDRCVESTQRSVLEATSAISTVSARDTLLTETSRP